MNVSHPEFDLLGFLIPLSLLAGVAGFLIAWLIVAVLEHLGLTRYVGNVSLFFIALGVLLAGLTDWLVKLGYTKICASVNGEVTNLDMSEGAYASAGQQVMALVDSDSYWVAGYFKETQLRNISTGDRATISLLGDEDQPFRGTVRSVGWGIFVTDGSSGENSLLPSVEGTALLPAVSPTIDWVRLPQRFPVRIQVDSSATGRLRIGQTASVAISHGARRENRRVIQ